MKRRVETMVFDTTMMARESTGIGANDANAFSRGLIRIVPPKETPVARGVLIYCALAASAREITLDC